MDLKIKEKLIDFKNIFKSLINKDNDPEIDNIIEALFFSIEKYYLEFKDYIEFIPIQVEQYKYHILQPIDGKYSLIDFLINRAFSNIIEINFGSNHYDAATRTVYIDKNRYNQYINQHDSNILEQFKLKSKLHEISHALFSYDDEIDGKFHLPDYSQSLDYLGVPDKNNDDYFRLLNKILSDIKLRFKYNNLLESIDFSLVQSSKTKLNSNSFGKHERTEGIVEVYANLFACMLYNYDIYEELKMIFPGKEICTNVPNFYNGYSPFFRFYNYLRFFVSKEKLFDSLFFASNSVLLEFATSNEDIINTVWFINKANDIRKKVFEYNNSELIKEFNYEVSTEESIDKLIYLLHVSSYCFVEKRIEKMDKNVLIAQECLEEIFLEAFIRKATSGSYDFSEFIEEIRYAHNSCICYYENNEFCDSIYSSKYRELYKLVTDLQQKINGQEQPETDQIKKQ